MNPSSSPVRRFLFFGLHALTAAALIAGAFFFFSSSRPKLPVYGRVPDFTLSGHDGRPFVSRDLAGKPWIASFVFSRCQGQCLVMNAQVESLRRELGSARFVSFTADPEFDSPETLAGYAGRYGAEAGRWTFVTGRRTELDRVSEALKFGKLGDPLFHSTRLVLVDSAFRVRGYYDSNEPGEMDRLKKDARALGLR